MTLPRSYLEPVALRGRIARPQPRGLPIVNMGFNELPYPPVPEVVEALAQAAQNVQSYGSPRCDLLRARLGDHHGLDSEAIVCSNGSEDLLELFPRLFARPGDEVLISEFGYINFSICTHRVGASLVKAPETALTTDVDTMLDRISDATRLIFLANPNNPTGTALPVREVERLVAGLPGRVVLVLDLAYGEFWGEDHCAALHALVERCDNVVVTRTFSKAYGLAGARVGWCHAPRWMVPLLYAARGMGPVSGLAQAAALAALDRVDIVHDRVAAIVSERNRMAAELARFGYDSPRSDANFLLTRRVGATPSETDALVEHLFDAGGLIVNRTREAGLESYFRFSVSLPAANALFLQCIQSFAPE